MAYNDSLSGHRLPVLARVAKTPSCHEILPRLYLGDICVATNKEEIGRLGITDMISVEIKPLQPDDLAPSVKRYLFISVMDHAKQDILSHFNTSNDFIEKALKDPCNKIYVHCVAGISRSATLVIAYIMKTRSMNFNEAFEMVSKKRKVVDPNEGFVRQLTLYYRMNYKIDIANMDYRRMILDALVFEFRLISLSFYQLSKSGSGLSSMIHLTNHINLMGQRNVANKSNTNILLEQYFNKLSLQQVSNYPDIYHPNAAFKCNKCRAVVFYGISVIENKLTNYETELSQSNTTGASSNSSRPSGESKGQNTKECAFIFIEPQPWMSKAISDRDGTLNCYKCKRKLGKFDWTSNESCSCARHNSHMNFNLFKIMRKKIDAGVI